MNTDQGSQFTGHAFTGVLHDHKIRISMDGRGRAMDNIMIERLWRTVKYDHIFLRDYETTEELLTGLREYFDYYNNGGRTARSETGRRRRSTSARAYLRRLFPCH